MSTPNHFILDFETLGSQPDTVILELSAIVFDPLVDEPYDELIANGMSLKIAIKDQLSSGRRTTQGAKDFWKSQPEELRNKMLVPNPQKDVSLYDATKLLEGYLKSNNIQPWKSIGWCRGQSFDFPILVEMLREVYKVEDTFEFEPIKFWNQRDIRSFISGAVGDYSKTNIPILESEAPGFVHHDSIHDCAKDILMIRKAFKLANGEELDFPEDGKYIESTLK